MSLTKRLDCKEARAFLSRHVTHPGRRQRHPVVVAPTGLQPQRMGTAFDYALRLALATSQDLPFESVAARVYARHVRPGQPSEAAERVAVTYERARSALAGFDAPDHLTEDHARGFLWLATLDPIHRARHYGDLSRPIEEGMVAELVGLYNLVPWDELIGFRQTVLNPSFGDGSLRVGGADADLVVDDVVVELKSGKRTGVQAKDIRQLVCYALLAQRFGVNGDPANTAIDHIAVYHARTGVLTVFRLDACVAPSSHGPILDFLLY